MEAPLLTEEAAAVWRHLHTAGEADVATLIAALGLDQSALALVAAEAAAAGFLEVEEIPREELDPTDDAAARLDTGLPERHGARMLRDAGGELDMPGLVAATKAAGLALNEVLKWGGARGWIARGKGSVTLTDAGRAGLDVEAPDEAALRLALSGLRFLDEIATHGIDPDAVRGLLSKRGELARLRPRKRRVLRLTDAGHAAVIAGLRVRRERNALTSEDLRSGAWRDLTLRPYDVTLPAGRLMPARMHPVRRVIEEIRRAFLELGFSEVTSPTVESSFWNFDALFQPQDHPAREMQDTFYLADPHTATLPDAATVDAVRRAHEDGGDTGSVGWGYSWSPDRARQMVLRTHTTAATIQALARHPDPPYKAFCVGWAYRNETYSYKHLPVFHQVDGIVIDEHASLASLLGMLTAFYQKMGFPKVKFKPAFYPYTEPSVDVVVYMPSRDRWIEMGGSGIFRPEVTEPLGCKHPVLAWGLGVERLAMLRLGFADIRELYAGGLDTVEGVPLCR